MEWSSRLTAIGLEMALPALGGYGLGRWLGTLPVFLILGVVLGFSLGMFETRAVGPAASPAGKVTLSSLLTGTVIRIGLPLAVALAVQFQAGP